MDDTSNVIKEIVTSGLQWEMLFTLFQLMVVGYIIIYLRSFLFNEFAWRKFKSSLVIGIGARVRLYNEAGSVDGRIISANRSTIKIETKGKDAVIYVPTKKFPEKEWVVLR
ncbi:MAG: hypothetical protein CMH64_02960 [Nanoarchaeota archaeon]|nr:hypothetical protein [Nanoarchaeota archaeon]|tara:strand:- start:2044 stop:2376 length:333 start_codon:yes stop_codon:yes gene_type:complete